MCTYLLKGAYSRREVASKYFADFEKQVPHLNGKTIVITGTTSGLGFVVYGRTPDMVRVLSCSIASLIAPPTRRAHFASRRLRAL